jgi:hypothetical protein
MGKKAWLFKCKDQSMVILSSNGNIFKALEKFLEEAFCADDGEFASMRYDITEFKLSSGEFFTDNFRGTFIGISVAKSV